MAPPSSGTARTILAMMAAGCLILSGCGDGDQDPAPTSSPSDTTAPTTNGTTGSPAGSSSSGTVLSTPTGGTNPVPLVAHDPPKKFADQPVALAQDGLIASIGGQISVSRWTLADKQAFVTTPEGVAKVDLSTGSSVWTTPPPGGVPSRVPQPFVTTDGPRAPVLSADGKTVYNATMGSVPGSGTTPGHRELVVQALDTAGGKPKWEAHVAIPRTVIGDYVSHSDFAVIAEVSGIVVARLQGDGDAFTAGVDAATGKARWTMPNADALGVTGSVVLLSGVDVKTDAAQLVGASVTTGRPLWAIKNHSDFQFVGNFSGRALLLMDNDNDQEQDNLLSRIDVRTGKVLTRSPGYDDGFECAMPAGTPAILCQGSFDVFAVNPKGNFGVLWQIPGKTDRVAPKRPAAYGPYVYGLANGKGVILNALSGKDVAVNQAAPFLIGPYGGIGLGPNNKGSGFYPATG